MPSASRPLSRGDIVLVPFPFTDLSSSKRRPAVVLASADPRGDVVLAFVTSRGLGTPATGDVPILPTHPEYRLTGLRVPSKVRAGKLVTLSRRMVTRWLGRLGPLLSVDLGHALVAVLGIDMVPYREEGRRVERSRLAALHESGGAAAVLADLGVGPLAGA